MFRTGKSTKTESRLVGCQGLEGENQREWLLIGMRFLRGVMKMFWSRQWWWKQSLAGAPGPADLHTSEGWMSRHADYISIKLLLKKIKAAAPKGRSCLIWACEILFPGSRVLELSILGPKEIPPGALKEADLRPEGPSAEEMTAAAFANHQGEGYRGVRAG